MPVIADFVIKGLYCVTAIIAIASSEPTGKQAELNLKLPNDRIKCTSSTRLARSQIVRLDWGVRGVNKVISIYMCVIESSKGI
ncbi:MAG TPA: hypothetical protein VH796_14575 [Nitrososphaeraceae archaeon]